MNKISRKTVTIREKMFVLALSMLLTLPVGCYSDGNRFAGGQPQTILAPDTLWTPTGDARLDSLLQLAAVAPLDTNLARLYINIGRMYKNNDYEKAKEYFLKLEAVSEQLDWNKGRYFYASEFALILQREQLTDSSVTVLRKALELAKREEDEVMTANMLSDIGRAYFFKGWYQMALGYYMEAIPVFEKMNKQYALLTTYVCLSQLYDNINVTEKAIEYGEKAVAIDKENIYALGALARAYSSAYEYEKANSYFEEALRLSAIQNNIYMTGAMYYHLSYSALKVFDLEKAEKYAHQSLEYKRQLSRASCCESFTLLSQIEMLKGHYAQSEAHAKEALEIAIEHEMLEVKRLSYVLLAELAVAQGLYRENVQYWNEWDLVDKEVARETVINASEEMAAKYETEKKELKITALEGEKRLMQWLGIAAGAGLLLALAVFFFLWRWTVQKKRVAEQQQQLAEQQRLLAEKQVQQLEQEKQLIATQALLDGETQERTRLARDLHDGLGSILAGSRLNFQEMKKGADMSHETLEHYNTAFGLLDESIHEMRRVAHHLMPESLTAVGLRQAAADFCHTIPHATFNYYGDETRLHPNLEIVLYRIMHELVNNALKHAKAGHIFVQIMQQPDVIALTVEDNGCGFDLASVSQGMGINNIRTRVAAFNGNLMIDSKPGFGTEVHVEFNCY